MWWSILEVLQGYVPCGGQYLEVLQDYGPCGSQYLEVLQGYVPCGGYKISPHTLCRLYFLVLLRPLTHFTCTEN